MSSFMYFHLFITSSLSAKCRSLGDFMRCCARKGRPSIIVDFPSTSPQEARPQKATVACEINRRQHFKIEIEKHSVLSTSIIYLSFH